MRLMVKATNYECDQQQSINSRGSDKTVPISNSSKKTLSATIFGSLQLSAQKYKLL